MNLKLTDNERAELGKLVGNGYLTRVRTRALIDAVDSMITAKVAGAQATAWDEGFKNRHSGGRIDPTDPETVIYGPNPYRGDQDAGDTP